MKKLAWTLEMLREMKEMSTKLSSRYFYGDNMKELTLIFDAM